jgi:CheY-like chemotaxis protein
MLALLIDDHTLFRKGLELLLKQEDPAMEVLEAGACEEAAGFADRDVALVFLDYHLPGLKGLGALDAARRDFTAPVIMLSGEEDAACSSRGNSMDGPTISRGAVVALASQPASACHCGSPMIAVAGSTSVAARRRRRSVSRVHEKQLRPFRETD